MTPRAVLFDVDGVLVDSAAMHRDVWITWAAANGLDADVVWTATHGRRPVDTIAAVASHLDAPAQLGFLGCSAPRWWRPLRTTELPISWRR